MNLRKCLAGHKVSFRRGELIRARHDVTMLVPGGILDLGAPLGKLLQMDANTVVGAIPKEVASGEGAVISEEGRNNIKFITVELKAKQTVLFGVGLEVIFLHPEDNQEVEIETHDLGIK